MAIASAVRREHTEGQIAKSIESQTATLPSDTFGPRSRPSAPPQRSR
jgi:hypothetical protein